MRQRGWDKEVETEVQDDGVEMELWDGEVEMEVQEDKVEAEVWEDEVGVNIWDNEVKVEVWDSDELETVASAVDIGTLCGEWGKILKEWLNHSPNESSALHDAFTPISLEVVNKGGIFRGMPLMTINASATQNDVVCLWIQ